jgi:tetratricopeptide (TPR) repeat protein
MHGLLWALTRRLVLVVAVLGGAASGAAAQNARELFDQGVQALNAGKHAEAVQAFDASYRKEPTPVALYNLGLAYKSWGRPDKALEAFEGYVKFANPKRDKATIDAVRGEIDRLKAGYGRFALKLTPAEAVIDIDGVRATPANKELWVPIGKHKISVSAPNFESYEQTLDVAAGRFDLEVQLREPSGPPPVRAALLVDEGMALMAGGKAQEGLDKFNAAHAIYPTARGTAQIGLAEEMLGNYGVAEMKINEALKQRKDPWIKENRKRLTASLRHMKKDAVTLDIQGSPLGAEIFHNGRPVGVLPLAPMRVASGTLTIGARKEGYSVYEEEITVLPRSKRVVMINMSEAPKPVVVPLPLAEPVPALPEPEPEPVVVAPPPAQQPPPDKTNQADFEANFDARDALKDEPKANDPAVGFELALNVGYQLWIGGPKPAGSDGALTPQVTLGARVPWFLSFGLQLQGGYDGSVDGTEFIVNANPGLYVRGHIQQFRKPLSFDAWAGVGFQPFAMQIIGLEPAPIDVTSVDPNDEQALGDLTRALGAREVGVDYVRTIQSINIPLELGATFYITSGFGIDLSMALTFWLPQQDCLHEDDKTRLCIDSDLDGQTSFFIGGGLSFLP